MLDADAATQKQLLIHQFLTELPTCVSRQLWAAGEIDDLDKVLDRRKCSSPLKNNVKQQLPLTRKIPAEVGALKEQISVLTEQVAALVTRRTAT